MYFIHSSIAREDVITGNKLSLGKSQEDPPKEWNKTPELTEQVMPFVTICSPKGKKAIATSSMLGHYIYLFMHAVSWLLVMHSMALLKDFRIISQKHKANST